MHSQSFNILQLLISELKSFIQELKSQLTTLYHQFAPLPAPPEDDEQLREKLNRLYIGASSVTQQKSPSSGSAGAAAIGDISSHAQQAQSLVATAVIEAGLPSQSSMMVGGVGGGGEGEEGDAACVCTAASHKGGGEEVEGGMEGVPHYRTTTVTTGNAGTVAPNDMHVSHITYFRVTVTNISADLHKKIVCL